MANNKTRQVTPAGFAKWAHLAEPKKNHFDKSKAPQYMVDVCFMANDPEWKAWAGDLKKQVEAAGGKNSPFKKEVDSEDRPTGRYFVTFKTGEKFKPHVYDKYGRLIDSPMVGNESKIKVSYVTSDYEGFGGGIALYMNAVQVLDLVEFKPKSADAFGFAVETVPPGLASANQNEEDLPF